MRTLTEKSIRIFSKNERHNISPPPLTMNTLGTCIQDIWKTTNRMKLALDVIKENMPMDDYRLSRDIGGGEETFRIPIAHWMEVVGIPRELLPQEFGRTRLRDGKQFPILFDGVIHVCEENGEIFVFILCEV
jgi:hypothetical protein